MRTIKIEMHFDFDHSLLITQKESGPKGRYYHYLIIHTSLDYIGEKAKPSIGLLFRALPCEGVEELFFFVNEKIPHSSLQSKTHKKVKFWIFMSPIHTQTPSVESLQYPYFEEGCNGWQVSFRGSTIHASRRSFAKAAHTAKYATGWTCVTSALHTHFTVGAPMIRWPTSTSEARWGYIIRYQEN